jgi:WD40 repeat protein
LNSWIHVYYLYVPLSDAPRYNHPCIGIYDAKTLAFEKSISLPKELHTVGVSWVAVNKNLNQFYTSDENAKTINVFQLQTGKLIKTISLSQEIIGTQGAKIFNGYMYLSADDEQKSVYKINLTTGTVMPVLSLKKDSYSEIEGLTIRGDIENPEMSLLRVSANEGNIFSQIISLKSEVLTLKLTTKSKRQEFIEKL